MKKNMGTIDRVIRLLVAAAIPVLYFNAMLTGTVAYVLLMLAGIFFLTSLTGVCPLYSLFGIKTCPALKK